MTSPELDAPRPHGWRPLVVILTVLIAVAAAAIAIALRSSSGSENDARSCATDGVRAETDVVPDEPATAVALSSAAEVLQRRLVAYDCNDPRVTVAQDRLHVSASAVALSHLDELLVPGRLEFREVVATRPARNCASSVRALRAVGARDRLTACSKDGSEQLDLLPAAVVGADVYKVTSQRDTQLGEWQILVHFTEAGQRRWTALTGRLVGKRLAIVLDGVVVSAPTIQERIDGPAQITGSFTEAGAKALTTQLESGQLVLPLHRA